jgi:hypothetical protein
MHVRARFAGALALLFFLVLVMPGLVMTGAAAQDSTPAAFASLGLPTLDLTVDASGLSGMPGSIAAGRYLVTVTGPPASPDHDSGAVFLQIPEGMTMDDLNATAATPAAGQQEGPPSWFYDVLLPGGVNLQGTGDTVSGSTVMDFVPGNWVASQPEFQGGPIPFTVTGEMPTDLPVPDSNATVTLSSFAIDVSSGALQAGENTIELENHSDQPHFLLMIPVPDGTTLDNVEATLQGDMSGTPGPGAIPNADTIAPVLSTVTQSGNTTQWVTANLEPGTYAALCFVGDKDTGVPHAFMGMYNVFTVEAGS